MEKKSRLLSLWLFSLWMLLASSCKHSDHAFYNSPDGNRAEHWLTLSVDRKGAVLRGESPNPYHRIENLLLLFFSQETEKLEVVKALDQVLPGEPFKTAVPQSDYWLIALANPTERVLAHCYVGNTLSAFRELALEGVRSFMNTEGRVVQSYVMVNDQGPLAVTRAHFKSKESEPVPLSIALEPCVPLLRVYGNPDSDAKIRRTESPGCFFVTGISKSTYLIRRFNVLLGGEALETPKDESPLNQRFAKSVGYSEIEQADAEALPSVLSLYRTYTHNKNIDISTYIIPPQKGDYTGQEDYAVVHETTMDAAHFFYSSIPFVYVRYQLYPSSISEGFVPENGWMSYKGRYYDGKVLTNYLARLKKSESATSDELPQDLSLLIRRLNQENRIPHTSTGETAAFDLDGLQYFYKSYNYYILPIYHDKELEGVGRFGLVRNNIYNIHIKRISKLGSPIIPDFSNRHIPYQEERTFDGGIWVNTPQEHWDEVEL